MRTWLPAAICLVALPGCRRAHGDAAPGELAARRHAPAAGECDAAALVVTPLVRDTSSGEDHPRVALGADGRLRRQEKIVGRVWGGCVLDARGRVLLSVDGSGVVRGAARERAGVFQRRPKWVDDQGKPLPVGEVLVTSDGETIGLTDDGSIFLAPPGTPPVSMPAGIEGDVAHARRTALLLYVVGGVLESE